MERTDTATHVAPTFATLPIELRHKIWGLTMSDARVLHVVRSPRSATKHTTGPGRYRVVAASYGGHHYAALSVNRESRAEALRYLTPLWGAYWNMQTDIPYLECKFEEEDAITQLAEMRQAGELDRFKRVALDWMYWKWQLSTQTMEFRATFGNRFAEYEHPIELLKAPGNIESVVFVITDHTLQSDILKPYVSWALGALSAKESLCSIEELESMVNFANIVIEEKVGKLENSGSVKIELMSIYGREREVLPPNRVKRGLQGWQLDWFG